MLPIYTLVLQVFLLQALLQMLILPRQYLQACSCPTSSCSHINIKLVLRCQASLNARTPESCSSQESRPLCRREGDTSLVVTVSNASAEHVSPEGQLQDRDLAPSSLLMWWCKYAITWASSGSVRIHNRHLALLWIPDNEMQSLWGCWIAGLKF